MFYKKNLLVAALALLIILAAASVNAQVLVKLSQPPPNQWNVEDLWQLTLTNTSQQDSYNVYLYGTVEEADAGIIFKATSADFELTLGFSGLVNRGDLEPVDVEYVNNDYEEIVQKTGTLPEGTYTICVYVKDADNYDVILAQDCITQPIMHPSPPELISPIDETIIEEELPVFVWMPPMPIPAGDMITYNLCIYELLDGQTAIEATEANPVWFEETEIFSTSFQYPISAREFEQGVTYAWQVTAVAEDKNWVIGKSEVWWFTYKELLEERTLIIKNISEGDTVGSMVVIVADVGEGTDIVECSFYVRWDNEWLLIAKESEFEDEWWTEVNTYAWVTLGNRKGELKVVVKTKKGKILESEPITIIVLN